MQHFLFHLMLCFEFLQKHGFLPNSFCPNGELVVHLKKSIHIYIYIYMACRDFETVTAIKGYTNTIVLTCLHLPWHAHTPTHLQYCCTLNFSVCCPSTYLVSQFLSLWLPSPPLPLSFLFLSQLVLISSSLSCHSVLYSSSSPPLFSLLLFPPLLSLSLNWCRSPPAF